MRHTGIFDNKRGDKGISLLIYLTFFALNAILALFMQSMTLDGEFTGAAAGAMLIGRDWFSVMPAVNSLGGFLQGVIYVPAMLICPDPEIQYKLFLVLCSAVYAIIPLCAFKLTDKFGIQTLWQRILIASVCGAYPAVVINSHFLLADALPAVLVWLLALILFRKENEDSKKKAGKFFMSVLAGFITACAYFLSFSCIALFIAVIAFCLYLHFIHKRRPVFLSAYAVTFLLLVSADTFFTFLAEEVGYYDFGGGIYGTVLACADAVSADIGSFFVLLGGRLYYFISSSWGLGAASLAMAVGAAVSYYRRKAKGKEQLYDEGYILAGIFCLIVFVLMVFANSFLSLSGEIASQDAVISSDAVFTVITPIIFLLFVYLFRYGINYLRLMAMIATVGISSFAAILMCTGKVCSLRALDAVGMAELCALRPGIAVDTPFNGDSLIYPICLIFTAFAAMVPVVCCTKKYASRITAFICAALIGYSTVYTGVAVMFGYTAVSREYAQVTAQINGFIDTYTDNPDNGAPLIVVYDTDKSLAMNLQYFNQGSRVEYIEKNNPLPESCFVISSRSVKSDGVCVLIGRTENINVYALGDTAVRYDTAGDSGDSGSNTQD